MLNLKISICSRFWSPTKLVITLVRILCNQKFNQLIYFILFLLNFSQFMRLPIKGTSTLLYADQRYTSRPDVLWMTIEAFTVAMSPNPRKLSFVSLMRMLWFTTMLSIVCFIVEFGSSQFIIHIHTIVHTMMLSIYDALIKHCFMMLQCNTMYFILLMYQYFHDKKYIYGDPDWVPEYSEDSHHTNTDTDTSSPAISCSPARGPEAKSGNKPIFYSQKVGKHTIWNEWLRKQMQHLILFYFLTLKKLVSKKRSMKTSNKKTSLSSTKKTTRIISGKRLITNDTSKSAGYRATSKSAARSKSLKEIKIASLLPKTKSTASANHGIQHVWFQFKKLTTKRWTRKSHFFGH